TLTPRLHRKVGTADSAHEHGRDAVRMNVPHPAARKRARENVVILQKRNTRNGLSDVCKDRRRAGVAIASQLTCRAADDEQTVASKCQALWPRQATSKPRRRLRLGNL